MLSRLKALWDRLFRRPEPTPPTSAPAAPTLVLISTTDSSLTVKAA